MRFLFLILSIIWILFGWVSIEAMRWRPPLPPPLHAEEALRSLSPNRLEKEKEQWQTLLNEYRLTDADRSWAHYQMATLYWVETYTKHSRPEQLQMLQKSLEHCFEALDLFPGNPDYLYAIADLYHQMKEYKQAENYYIKALREKPDHQRARMRYKDLRLEMEKA